MTDCRIVDSCALIAIPFASNCRTAYRLPFDMRSCRIVGHSAGVAVELSNIRKEQLSHCRPIGRSSCRIVDPPAGVSLSAIRQENMSYWLPFQAPRFDVVSAFSTALSSFQSVDKMSYCRRFDYSNRWIAYCVPHKLVAGVFRPYVDMRCRLVISKSCYLV